jgi:hypothetical protein
MKRMNKYLGFPSGFAFSLDCWSDRIFDLKERTDRKFDKNTKSDRSQRQSVEIEGGITIVADHQLKGNR